MMLLSKELQELLCTNQLTHDSNLNADTNLLLIIHVMVVEAFMCTIDVSNRNRELKRLNEDMVVKLNE